MGRATGLQGLEGGLQPGEESGTLGLRASEAVGRSVGVILGVRRSQVGFNQIMCGKGREGTQLDDQLSGGNCGVDGHQEDQPRDTRVLAGEVAVRALQAWSCLCISA